ncbi:hypothetical protein ACH3XW_43055 [Acanthocheilonema viteae]
MHVHAILYDPQVTNQLLETPKLIISRKNYRQNTHKMKVASVLTVLKTASSPPIQNIIITYRKHLLWKKNSIADLDLKISIENTTNAMRSYDIFIRRIIVKIFTIKKQIKQRQSFINNIKKIHHLHCNQSVDNTPPSHASSHEKTRRVLSSPQTIRIERLLSNKIQHEMEMKEDKIGGYF